MAFWRNSQYDLQSRRAAIAQDIGQWDTPLPSLLGKDTFFRGPGQAPDYDWPNPSFAVVRNAAYRAAQLAQSTDQVHQFLHELDGKDLFRGGFGKAPNWDWPNPSFVVQSRAAYRAAQLAQDSTQVHQFTHELDGKDALAVGQSTLDTRLPPRINTGQHPWKAQDSVDSGLALFDAATAVGLPPGDTICSAHQLTPAALSRREYGQTVSFPLSLIGQDAVNAGESSEDLPPRGPARARDYTWLQTFALDVYEQLPVGGSTTPTELPAHAPLRAREYGQASSFPLELIGQDQLPVGDQRTDLAPRGPARAVDYTWIRTFPQELRGQDQFNAGEQSTDLPPRGALRAREYGQASSFPLELIAQDQFNAGEQSFDLPTPVAPRRQPALEPGVTSLALTAPPVGVQVYDLAPRGFLRARDYTFTASFPLELIGQDAFNVGEQLYDLPPRAAARIQSTFEPGVEALALPVPPTNLPYGVQVYDLPTPPAPKRARDYTWLQSFPLELIGKDQRNAGQSTDLTALPPKASARARDYSFVHPFPLELIGKDQRNTGQSTDLTALPPRGPARSRDYTFVLSFPLELIGKDRFNAGAQVYDLPTPARPRHQSPLESGADALALTVQPVALPNGALLFDLPPTAGPRRQPALEVGAQSIALEETVAPTPTPVVPEEPKPGGLGQRRRLTRFRRGADARFLSGTLEAPTARLQATLRASWATRELSAWLTPASPGLRLRARALNPRHAQATFAAPTPSLLDCRQSTALGCTTLAVQVARPSLSARLRQLPPPVADESWLLAVLLSDARSALRNWQGETTKRLSNLQRQANAHAARTDTQQERLVQASLPHLRHALMAQRDAALVALPHATKASIDPQFILDNDGFKAAVALLVQAIEDLQEAGVTLGYTDTSPSDVFDLHNPYVTAAVQTLNTRISGITTTTADAIRAVIATGLDEGWTIAEMGGAIQQLGAFSDARALMLARTESRVALNFGNAASWQEMGVDQVLISDGDYDEVCAELDGTTQSLDWYMANPVGHPSCRRSGTAIPTA